jgi:hypothetical protein
LILCQRLLNSSCCIQLSKLTSSIHSEVVHLLPSQDKGRWLGFQIEPQLSSPPFLQSRTRHLSAIISTFCTLLTSISYCYFNCQRRDCTPPAPSLLVPYSGSPRDSSKTSCIPEINHFPTTSEFVFLLCTVKAAVYAPILDKPDGWVPGSDYQPSHNYLLY